MSDTILDSELRKEFKEGSLVMLDVGFRSSGVVEVVKQSPHRLYTTVLNPISGYIWDVMTNRLTTINNMV